MTIIKPALAIYGNSFGQQKGSRLTDMDVSSYDYTDLNNKTLMDGVEFNHFETTVKDYILGRLGFPVVRVELTPFQLKICIEEAISKLQYYAPVWMTQYVIFEATAGCNIYEIPKFIMNSLTNVTYRRNLFLALQSSNNLEFDFFWQYFQNNRLFSSYNIGEFYLFQMYYKQVRKVLSNHGTWDVIDGKYLQIFPMPWATGEPVILEYRALNSDTVHPYYKNWIQKYATACAKEILGQIRGKFKTLPGPGGGASMNGESLISEAQSEKSDLTDDLMSEIQEPAMFKVC